MRRREFAFGVFGSIVYLACGSDRVRTEPDEPEEPPSPAAPDASRPEPPESVAPTSSVAESDRVFPQGLASGDPRPDRVVLWTRVEPAEANKGDGEDVDLELVIARDEALTDLVARTTLKASAASDHAVRVVPTELEPGRFYWYRFGVAGGATTQVGRTKTAPEADADVSVMFAMCSCQDMIGRYWHSWRALLDEEADLDFILFLGDYIYESVNDARFQSTTPERAIELPDGIDTSPEQDKSRIAANTLADYRTLYKAYRRDPLIRAVHQLYPFIITWDDHEFADDCWQDHSTSFNGRDPVTKGPLISDEKSTARRTAANRAFFEYQPLDVTYNQELSFPFDIKIYRQLRYGKHVELFMTDQRSYRADHLIPEGQGADPAVGKFTNYSMVGSRYFVRKSVFDPREATAKPSLLGATQKSWFLDAVKSSTATWKVWGNEVQMYQMALDLSELPGIPGVMSYTAYVNCDQWDGFRSERAEILDALSKANVDNLLVCTGDIHSFYAAELHVDFDAPEAKPVGVEFVTAGISSASLRALLESFITPGTPLHSIINSWAGGASGALMRTNAPYLKYADTDAYGFTLMTIDGDKVETTFMHVSDPLKKAYGGVLERTRFITKAGTNVVTPL